jgi:hypothetical protein
MRLLYNRFFQERQPQEVHVSILLLIVPFSPLRQGERMEGIVGGGISRGEVRGVFAGGLLAEFLSMN